MLDVLGNTNDQETVVGTGHPIAHNIVADETTKVVAARNLRFQWQKSAPWVIDIDELFIQEGERILLMGPSGSGKTTLLNLLAGVTVPDSGTLHVLDTQLHRLSGPRRDAFRADHIGIVFQMFNLIPYLSLVDNVLLSLRFSTLRHQRVLKHTTHPALEAKRLLGQLGLEPDALGRQPVTRLSVGQQQRVAVARALIGRPEIVICDEPTSALDADARGAFLELLFKEVGQAGATLIFVSHDQSLASYFDRTISLPCINGARSDGGAPRCN